MFDKLTTALYYIELFLLAVSAIVLIVVMVVLIGQNRQNTSEKPAAVVSERSEQNGMYEFFDSAR